MVSSSVEQADIVCNHLLDSRKIMAAFMNVTAAGVFVELGLV